MIDELAQIIRRVDGNHSLGAGALAEAIVESPEFTKMIEQRCKTAWHDGASFGYGYGRLDESMAHAYAVPTNNPYGKD